MALLLYSGTNEDDYREYTDFDEEPQSKTDYERISLKPAQPTYGCFRQSIPIMSNSLAVFCLLLNILLPGSGTMLAGLSILCGSDPRGNGTMLNCVGMNLLCGLLQLLTAPFLIGWIWSILWGVIFVQIATKWFISDLDNRAGAFCCCCPCSVW